MHDLKLRVSEIFYSLQGEGARAGSANIFIRLQGCKTKHACAAGGIKCDTEFESGNEKTLDELFLWCARNAPRCNDIIWTGGEPADQLTEEIVQAFAAEGFVQHIETSGLLPVPESINWVSLSPKVAEHIIEKNFAGRIVDELRYIRHAGQAIPQPAIKARFNYISPHSDGNEINLDNLRHCITLIKENPTWSLSVQQHKLWKVL